MSKINRYTRAMRQIRTPLSEAPTNSMQGIYVDTPFVVTTPPEEVIQGQGADYTQDDSGGDTSGLFDSNGDQLTAVPPETVDSPDNSYILGPMASMWYSWGNFSTIGYIREADRKMVNLASITGPLHTWDKTSGFNSYGQLTLEQAKWFVDNPKYGGVDNDYANANYRAYYPGPPSSSTDSEGRYLCTITGVPKTLPSKYQPPDDFTPGTNVSADDEKSPLKNIVPGSAKPKGEDGEGVDWEKIGQGVETALTIADGALMVASLIGILIPEPATSAAGAAGVMSVLSKLRWANKARKAGSLAKGLKGLRVGATGLKQGGYQAIKSTAKHKGSKGIFSAFGKKHVYAAPKVGKVGQSAWRPGSGASRYVKYKANPLARGGSPTPGGVVGSVTPGGARGSGVIGRITNLIEPQTAVPTKTFTKGAKLFKKVMGGQYKNSATANRIRSMAKNAGFGGGKANVPFKNLPKSGAKSVKSVKSVNKSLKQKAKDYINKGKYEQMPGEDTASLGQLVKNDWSQMGKFIKKGSRHKLPKDLKPSDFEGGPIPTNLDQLGQFVQGKGGASWSFSRGAGTGPTPLTRQLVTRGVKAAKNVGRKVNRRGRVIKNAYEYEDILWVMNESAEDRQDEILMKMMNDPKFSDRLPEIIKNMEDEVDLLELFEFINDGMDGEGEDEDPNADMDPRDKYRYTEGPNESYRESTKKLLREIKQPYVMPEEKKVKLTGYKPKLPNPDKMRQLADSMNVPEKVTFAKAETGTWKAGELERGRKSSQAKKNEVLELLGQGEDSWVYMTETSRKKSGKAMYENFTLMNEQGVGTYKISRKEPLRSDYVLFLEYEDGTKSTMLQSELNEIMSDQSEKWRKDWKEPVKYEDQPAFKKVKKILNKEIPLKDIQPEFPKKAPPKTVNGWHPDYGKRQDYFSKLDPDSAKAMAAAPTGTPEIDAEVEKAKKKPK